MDARKLTQNPGGLRWLRMILMALFVIGGGGALYVFSYVGARERDFSEQAFRSLSVIAADFNARVLQVDRTFSQIVRITRDSSQTLSSSVVDSKIELIRWLESDPIGFPRHRASGDSLVGASALGTAIQIRLGDQARVRFRHDTSDVDDGIFASGLLSEMLGATRVGGEFDEIVMATVDGTVLYRAGTGALPITKLTGLIDVSRADSADASLRSGLLRGSGRKIEVEVAGKRFVLFTHPMRPLFPTSVVTTGAEPELPVEEWLIGGLVDRQRLSANTRQLPADVMMVLLSLVVVGVLAAPFLKLLYVGSSERYGAIDVLFLTTSGVISLALVTLITIDVVERARFNLLMDQEAHRLWEEIVGNFETELTETRDALAEFFAHSNTPAFWDGPDELHILQDSVIRSQLEDAPFVEMAFWADTTGAQRKKWTVQGQSTARLADISDRRYFAAARDPTLQPPIILKSREMVGDHAAGGYAFELIRSKTTGQTFTSVSIPLRDQPGSVGAAVINPLSVTVPALPLGFSFVIVDSDGWVVLRSAVDQHAENIFAECNDSGRLRSGLLARRAEHLSVRCRGAARSAYMGPIGDQPYALIVFRDSELFAAINFEVVIGSLFLFALPTVLVLSALTLFVTIAPRRQPKWNWPDLDRTPLYFQSIGVVVVLGIWSLAAALFEPGLYSLWVGFGAPAVAVIVVSLLLARGLPKQESFARRQRIAFAAGLLTFALGAASAGGTRWLASLLVAVALGFLVYTIASPRCNEILETVIRGARNARADDPIDENALRVGYSGLAWVLALILAVPPSVVVFRDSLEHGLESLARLDQLHGVRAYREHRARVNAEVRYGLATSEEIARGEYQSTLFVNCVRVVRRASGGRDEWRAAPPDCAGGDGTLGDSTTFVQSVGPDATMPGQLLLESFDSALAGALACDTSGRLAPPPRQSHHDDVLFDVPRALVQRHFTAVLKETAPAYSETVEQFRRITVDREGENRWRWLGPTSSGCLALRDRFANSDSVLVATSTIPPWIDAVGPLGWFLGITGIVVVLSVAGGVTHMVARRVFGLDLETEVDLPAALPGDGRGRAADWIDEPLLLIKPPAGLVSALRSDRDVFYVRLPDLPVDATLETLSGDSEFDRRIVVLDHLEIELGKSDTGVMRQRLIASLTEIESKLVVIISPEDPASRFDSLSGDAEFDRQMMSAMERWNTVLTVFQRRDFIPGRWSDRFSDLGMRPSIALAQTALPRELNPEWHNDLQVRTLVATLRQECEGDDVLTRIAVDLLDEPKFKQLTPEQVVDLVRQQADSYYRALWNRRNTTQRLLLIRIAEEGFVNPKAWHLVRRLRADGLVKKDPALRLMNESFREFVLGVESPATIARWESQQETGVWANVRGPLILFAVAAAVFFFATQRDRLNVTMGFVGSLAALIPAVIKIVGMSIGRSSGVGGGGGRAEA